MNYKQLARRLWSRCRSRATAYYRALTKDFNYSSDHFFGLDFLMAAGGMRLNSRNVKLRRWWNLYRCLCCLPLIVLTWNAVLNVTQHARIEIVLNSLQGLTAILITILRMLLLTWHYEPLMAVRRYINQRSFGRSFNSSLVVRSEAFYQVRRAVIILVMLDLCAVVTPAFTIGIPKHHLYRLPFNIRAWLPKLQVICEKMNYCLFIGISVMIVLDLLSVYMVLTGLMAEVKVIAEGFSMVFDKTEKRVQQKMESEPGPSSDQESELRTLLKKFYFLKYAQEEFNECIEQHIEFMANLRKVRPLLNATFLIVYYSTAMSLSCGAIYLVHVKSFTPFTFTVLYYCIWIALECLVLTRMVTLLTEAHETISWEVYCLDWPMKLEWDDLLASEYRSIRKTMIIVMTFAQQPLRLNCFGFFEFTQERFTELVMMAYDLYSFLKNFV